jgi:hypothetical protein
MERLWYTGGRALEDAGFPHAVAETLVMVTGPSGVSLFAFTHGRGVWKSQLP